jgi:hypothetical protein
MKPKRSLKPYMVDSVMFNNRKKVIKISAVACRQPRKVLTTNV